MRTRSRSAHAAARAAPRPRRRRSPRVDPAAPNPLLGLSWFVDKTWAPQYAAYQRHRRRGQSFTRGDAGKIALQPQFKWFGRWNEDDKGGTAGIDPQLPRAGAGGAAGRVAQVVIMRHQGKACHRRYTAGGAREDERTKR